MGNIVTPRLTKQTPTKLLHFCFRVEAGIMCVCVCVHSLGCSEASTGTGQYFLDEQEVDKQTYRRMCAQQHIGASPWLQWQVTLLIRPDRCE